MGSPLENLAKLAGEVYGNLEAAADANRDLVARNEQLTQENTMLRAEVDRLSAVVRATDGGTDDDQS